MSISCTHGTKIDSLPLLDHPTANLAASFLTICRRKTSCLLIDRNRVVKPFSRRQHVTSCRKLYIFQIHCYGLMFEDIFSCWSIFNNSLGCVHHEDLVKDDDVRGTIPILTRLLPFLSEKIFALWAISPDIFQSQTRSFPDTNVRRTCRWIRHSCFFR